MGRTRIFILIALTLTLIICANSQTRRTHAGSGAGKLKAKQALVDKLPDGVEGVELKNNAVRIKPGYKFVKEGNTVKVMARRGGNNVSGTWGCYCKSGSGSCSAIITNGVLGCSGGTCTSCDMTVVVNGLKTAVLMY